MEGVSCHFCNTLSIKICETCNKALCGRCFKISHCKYTCEICKGRDQTTPIYCLHSLCTSCLPRSVQSTSIVFWEMVEDSDLSEINEKITSTFPFDYVFMMVSPSEDFVGEVQGLIDRIDEEHINDYLLISDSEFNFQTAHQISTTKKVRIYRVSQDLNSITLIVPIAPLSLQSLIQRVTSACSEGQIAIKYSDLYTEEEQNAVNIALAQDEIHFVGSLNDKFIALTQRKCDKGLLECSVKALETHGLLPFVSRIHDILENTFNAKVLESEIVNFTRTWVGINIFESENSLGKTEKAISTRRVESFSNQINAELYEGIQRTLVSNPSIEISGLYSRSLYYSDTMRLDFAEVYKILELIIDKNHPSLLDLKNIVRLVIEESSIIRLQDLELSVSALIYPSMIKVKKFNFSSFEDFIERSPDFELIEGKAKISKTYLPDYEEECPICFEEIKSTDLSLNCNHRFHRNCLKQFVEKCKINGTTVSCPSCRTDIIRTDISRLKSSIQAQSFNCLKDSLKLSLEDFYICLNPACRNVFPYEQQDFPCNMCGKSFCWNCHRERNLCNCQGVIMCPFCSFANPTSEDQDYKACELCGVLICVQCKISAAECAHF